MDQKSPMKEDGLGEVIDTVKDLIAQTESRIRAGL